MENANNPTIALKRKYRYSHFPPSKNVDFIHNFISKSSSTKGILMQLQLAILHFMSHPLINLSFSSSLLFLLLIRNSIENTSFRSEHIPHPLDLQLEWRLCGLISTPVQSPHYYQSESKFSLSLGSSINISPVRTLGPAYFISFAATSWSPAINSQRYRLSPVVSSLAFRPSVCCLKQFA